MTASADRLTVAGPRPKEFWLTVGLSILLHGLLMAVVILMPRFRIGTYVNVPVSYTVDLVSATPGGRAAASAPATAPSAPANPAAPAPRPAPPVRLRGLRPGAARPGRRSSEELTLPGKRPARKAPAEVEPSLRPPPVTGRETLRPAPVDVRPRRPVETPPPLRPGCRPGSSGGLGRARRRRDGNGRGGFHERQRSRTRQRGTWRGERRVGARLLPRPGRLQDQHELEPGGGRRFEGQTSSSFVSESCPRGMSGTWSWKRARGTPGWTTRRCAPFGRVCRCRRSPTC